MSVWRGYTPIAFQHFCDSKLGGVHFYTFQAGQSCLQTASDGSVCVNMRLQAALWSLSSPPLLIMLVSAQDICSQLSSRLLGLFSLWASSMCKLCLSYPSQLLKHTLPSSLPCLLCVFRWHRNITSGIDPRRGEEKCSQTSQRGASLHLTTQSCLIREMFIFVSWLTSNE